MLNWMLQNKESAYESDVWKDDDDDREMQVK